MRLGPITVSIPTLVTVALGLAVGGTLVIAAATSGAAFDPFNPAWEGLSEVRGEATAAGLTTHVATGGEAYDDLPAEGTVALVVEPSASTPAQRARLRTFVDDGGTVLIAAREPGTANPLLAALGTDIRVAGAPLRDEREYWRTPDFPIVTSTAAHPYVRGVRGLSLNHGTGLVVEGDARPLANSSAFSYLDRGGDGTLDDADELAARPVIALDTIGAGEVLVVSDPSVLINAMLEHDANRVFVTNVLGAHERVLLDRTTGGVPPLVALLLSVRDSASLAGSLAVAVVVAILAWDRRILARARSRWQERRERAPDRPDEQARGADASEPHVGHRETGQGRARRTRHPGGVFRARTKTRDDERRR